MSSSNTIFFAPGRVNLIGEHLDYNGGLVLPMAIQLGITARVTYTTGDKIQIKSDQQSEDFHYLLGAKVERSQIPWHNYVLGVLEQLKIRGIALQGMQITLESSLPGGAGLSSSASLELVLAKALDSEGRLTKPQLAEIGLKAENEFVGVQCGAMDQLAVAFGKKDHALLINCRNWQMKPVRCNIPEFSWLVIDSRKERSLSDSAFNQRQSECKEALKELQMKTDIEHLSEIKEHHFPFLTDEVITKRCAHIYSEMQRVNNFTLALTTVDLSAIGLLMNGSHHSLKTNFAVSCDELDFLADCSIKQKTCVGARMTGAGFGGCLIALVESSHISQFQETVALSYQNAFGLEPHFYLAKASDGVGRVLRGN